MDNERPIEKLLRRYAKKRRDDAGAPLELHPATRGMLQGEVARQFRKERSEHVDSSGTSVRWWPRLAYGLCALAGVALVAAILLPGLTKSKSPSFEMAATKDSRTDRPLNRTPADEKEQLSSTRQIILSEAPALSLDRRTTLAPTTDADAFGLTETNSMTLAYANRPQASASTPLITPREEGALAVGPATVPPELTDKMNENLLVAAEGRGTTTAGQALPGEGKRESNILQYKAKTDEELQRKSPTQLQTAARFSNYNKPGSKSLVLQSFQVEQNGDELRVIDSDGSAYDGNIVTAVDQTEAAKDLLKKAEQKAPASQRAARGSLESTVSRDSSVQNTFFRVSGTNKTLRQQVVFTGNFVAVSNASQPPPQKQSGVAALQTMPAQQLLPLQLSNSIIVGRAQLERDSDIEINAVPVSQ